MRCARLSLILFLAAGGCLEGDLDPHIEDEDGESDGSSDPAPAFTPACHPLDQAFNCDVPGECGDCPVGAGCYPYSGSTAFECFPGGQGGFGASCTFSAECQRGSLCIPREVVPGCSDNFGCCTWFCDMDDHSCPTGTYCAEYFNGAAPVGFESLGACVPKG